MKNENSIANVECDITGSTPSKNEPNLSTGTIKRNPINGQILRMTHNDFIERAKTIHKNKYNYSKTIYVRSNEKVCIVCPVHGEFWQLPTIHLKGNDCLQCGYDKTHNKVRGDKIKFVEKANDIHENKYDYSKLIYINSRTKVIIICPIHGEFEQTPDAHIQGRGCPSCNSSKAEIKIRKWLVSNNIYYIYQKTFGDCKNPLTNYPLRFDFYIPSKNLLIEYDGLQHFQEMTTGKYTITKDKLDDNKYRDQLKTNYATDKNIELLRISYSEFKEISHILNKKIGG